MALAVIGVGVWRVGVIPAATGWWWLTFGFALLALGPFVIVAGVNTHVPGPWALLRYVPVVGAARMPTRFAIVAALGIAVLLAGALAALGDPLAAAAPRAGLAPMLLLVGFELWPAPRTLYSGGDLAALRPHRRGSAAGPRAGAAVRRAGTACRPPAISARARSSTRRATARR